VLEVVGLRLMFDVHGPAEGSIEAPLTVLADLDAWGVWSYDGAPAWRFTRLLTCDLLGRPGS